MSKLPVFEKNFYIEHPAVVQRPDTFSEGWRKDKEIVVVGHGVPKPVLTFEEASMPEYVLREVMKQGFTSRKLKNHFFKNPYLLIYTRPLIPL